MKASKAKSALHLIGSFLKDRHYLDNGSNKKSFTVMRNCKSLAMNSIVKASTGAHDAINFIDSNITYPKADEEYKRFLDFVRESSEPYKSELTHLLFPIFVNIYIELVYKEQCIEAQKFFNSHCNLYEREKSYKSVIQDLRKLTTVRAIAKHSYFRLFRQKKFSVNISEDTVQYLARHLKDLNNLIILQLITLYVCIENDTCDYLHDTDELNLCDFEDFADADADNAPGLVNSNQLNLNVISGLESAIEAVSSGPLNCPYTQLYTLGGRQWPCSVDVPLDSSLLAAGYESSDIYLWSLHQSLDLKSHPAPTDISKIYLACDEFKGDDDSSDDHDDGIRYERVLKGHSGSVYGLSFTPCRQILLSCSDDKTVRAWDMKTFKNIVVYIGHDSPIWDIDTSAHFSYFATCSKDTTARLWTTDHIYPMRILAGHDSDVNCVKFHPNCNYVATGSSDTSVRLWSVQTGSMVRVLCGHKRSVRALAFSPNGQLLASADDEYCIKIWDLGSSTELKELRGHTDSIYSMCFNGDGSLLASGGYEDSLKFWDVRQNQLNTSAAPSTSSRSSSQSPELLLSLPTNSASVHHVKFNKRNVLLAVEFSDDWDPS